MDRKLQTTFLVGLAEQDELHDGSDNAEYINDFLEDEVDADETIVDWLVKHNKGIVDACADIMAQHKQQALDEMKAHVIAYASFKFK